MADTSTIVATEWNGYQFKMVEKSDFPKILLHLRSNFYIDEPMHKILGVPPERIADMDEKLSAILGLEHGSFYVHPVGQPQQVAAVLIIWHQQKGSELPHFEARSHLTKLVKKTISTLKQQYSIHEQRSVDEYPELFIISTDREHRGKGLATEMYRRAIADLKSQGHKLVSSTFTNPMSRKIGDKLGFKQVSRIGLSEVKDDDGNLIFADAGNEHFIIETVLDL